jgi:hypothetical protein
MCQRYAREQKTGNGSFHRRLKDPMLVMGRRLHLATGPLVPPAGSDIKSLLASKRVVDAY